MPSRRLAVFAHPTYQPQARPDNLAIGMDCTSCDTGLGHPRLPLSCWSVEFPHRVPVADVVPNTANLSLYGQVVRVSVRDAPLPAVLPACPRLPSQSQRHSGLSQPQPKWFALPGTPAGADPKEAPVAELAVRDGSGETTILCLGKQAVEDALRCR